MCQAPNGPTKSEVEVRATDDRYVTIALWCEHVISCVCLHTTVMFVDVGNNRNVLENLSLSFVSPPYTDW